MQYSRVNSYWCKTVDLNGINTLHFDGGWFMAFWHHFQQYLSYIWSSVLLVEETGVPRENDPSVASHWQILSHNVVLSTPRHEGGSNSQHQWW